MSEEILVNFTPMETRVALMESGSTQEIHIERTAHRGIVGNIYAGSVVRVLPGMQAAFVDIGVERTSFINAADIVGMDDRGPQNQNRLPDTISSHLHEGQKIIVQVIKDPLGTKGARLTTQLYLSSQ